MVLHGDAYLILSCNVVALLVPGHNSECHCEYCSGHGSARVVQDSCALQRGVEVGSNGVQSGGLVQSTRLECSVVAKAALNTAASTY